MYEQYLTSIFSSLVSSTPYSIRCGTGEVDSIFVHLT